MMKKRIPKVLVALLATSCLMLQRETVTAQQQITREKDNQKSIETRIDNTRELDNSLSVELERGGKIIVDNRTTGRIVVIGWDKNIVEARASSERGVEAVRSEVTEGTSGKSVWLKADYAKGLEPQMSPTQPKPEATPTVPPEPKPEVSTVKPTPSMPAKTQPSPTITPKLIYMPGTSKYDGLIEPPMRDGHPVEVHLEVRVPRYAEIEVIKVNRSPVEITGVETPLTIFGDKSDVVLRNVGAVEAQTRSGTIEVENASGLVDAVTTSGVIRIRRAGSDVRALTIGGLVDIQCARGRVDVSTTDGPIRLINIGGDVDATTTNSEVRFTGAIREDGRYHLKSMSGYVEMTIQANPPGFTAALSSYKGMVSTGFLLKIKQPAQPDSSDISVPPPFSRRLTGRYGNGRAQLTLDSFDGVVLLNKGLPSALKDCK